MNINNSVSPRSKDNNAHPTGIENTINQILNKSFPESHEEKNEGLRDWKKSEYIRNKTKQNYSFHRFWHKILLISFKTQLAYF